MTAKKKTAKLDKKAIRAKAMPFLRQANRRSGKNAKPGSEWEKVGVAGVDAGLIWIGDPCYVLGADLSEHPYMGDWIKFCDALEAAPNRDVVQHNYAIGHAGIGVSVSSGYGDGCYPVFIKRDLVSGRVAEAKIVFIDSGAPEYDESDMEPENGD